MSLSYTFPEPQLISVNNIELEVFTAGTGRPIVLCHGWPEHAFSWRYQVAPLVEAGYQVIIPNQRGYGASSKPDVVEEYDIVNLTRDLVSLLDHFGLEDALFVGHDWGAIVVWNLSLMHPNRVAGVVNLSVPFMQRGEKEWVGFWEEMLGGDFYIVHFNRQPGVADQAFADNCERFLGNLYRTNQWQHPPVELPPGMNMIEMAKIDNMPGDPLMSEQEFNVFVDAFKANGFTPGINWYRNFSRNWETIGQYEQLVTQPTLMIYGDYDMVPPSEDLPKFAPDLEVHSLPCGHWIQQEQPEATNRIMLDWVARRYPA